MFLLLPVIHNDQLRPDTDTAQAVYFVIFGVLALAHLGIILSYRSAEQGQLRHAAQ